MGDKKGGRNGTSAGTKSVVHSCRHRCLMGTSDNVWGHFSWPPWGKELLLSLNAKDATEHPIMLTADLKTNDPAQR